MDVMSELLNGLRFKGPVYFEPAFASPWSACVRAHQASTVRLHLVTHGQCWIGIPQTAPFVQLTHGDFALVFNGQAHVLADRPDRAPMFNHDIPDRGEPDAILAKARPSADPKALGCQLVCGYFTQDESRSHPMWAGLPSLLSVRAAESGPHAPLLPLLRFALLQTAGGRPGSEVLLRRLAEMLVIEAVGIWAQAQPSPSGYLAAMADPGVGRALRAMHEQYQHAWTVASLAALAGASRTTFSSRFAALVGESPMAYLSNWRLTVARRLLSEGELSLDRVADRVGYRSCSSFSRVFRRTHGLTPGRFRAT